MKMKSPNKSMNRLKLFAALSLCLLCTACGAYQETQLAQTKTDAAASVSYDIKLAVVPFTNPLSTTVHIKEDGSVEAVTYTPTGLLVTSVRAGRMTKAEQARIAQRIHASDFSEACNDRSFGGGGLTRGDRFQLLIASPQQKYIRRCAGFIEDAPIVVRQLIQDLLSLTEQLPPVPLAAAYVRSEPVAAERLAAIRRAGQMRLNTLSDFTPELQSLLNNAADRPHEFIPLTRQQAELIRTRIASAHEFILTTANSGYQLTLFQAQPAPSSKGV